MPDTTLPIYIEYLYPTLVAMAGRQGSARTDEIISDVIAGMSLTVEQVAVEYPATAKAQGSKVVHRIRFALTYLRAMAAIESSERAVWRLTPRGRELLAAGDNAVRSAYHEMKKEHVQKDAPSARPKASAQSPGVANPEDPDDLPAAESWRSELLGVLAALPPDAFERLCARLLREAGCIDVMPSGRPGDEGIDGVATLQVSLVSFPVYFQAKRYKPTQGVGPEKVRELRGALHGRGEKGILITTGYFTPGAIAEARRGGSPIDLIGGDRLCDLLLEYGLGVEARPVVTPDFFEGL